nr:5427_t:CDS:1 [Entrophospora candida]
MLSSKHNYPDGDIIIIVKDKSFKIHKLILSLASQIFKDLFIDAATSSNTQLLSQGIQSIELDEPMQTFEDLLDFIYPGSSLLITWDNVAELFRIADKYLVDSFIERGKEFLEREFQSRPLLSLVLADLYRFKNVYKSSSKLVLDNFSVYKSDQLFSQLSVKTQGLLLDRYCDYFISWSKDYQGMDFNENFTHSCQGFCRKEHIKKIQRKITGKLESTRTFPPPSPSIFYKMVVKTLQEKNYDTDDCDKNYLFVEFPKLFENLFGKFEPLKGDVNVDNELCGFYIFIEMKY